MHGPSGWTSSWLGLGLIATCFLVACGSDSAPAESVATPVELPATATPAPAPAAEAVRRDIRPTRLTIPSLNIDTEVQESRTILASSQGTPPPGCPAPPATEETLTVPDQGVATPAQNLEGLENKAWIFGHSRWLNRPGIFFALQDINIGDVVIIDGVDRASDDTILRQHFVVDAIYLTDIHSGEEVFFSDIPAKPLVILQTSVREDGAGKQWLLNQDKVLAKATNVVQGDLADPCKYLLLFVLASAA